MAKEDLEAQLLIASGQFFARSEVVASAEGIKNRLSQDGYAFARVNPVPDVPVSAAPPNQSVGSFAVLCRQFFLGSSGSSGASAGG